jgi:hypothetical protein
VAIIIHAAVIGPTVVAMSPSADQAMERFAACIVGRPIPPLPF